MATISIGSQDRLRTSVLTDTNVFKESNLGDYIKNINDNGIIEGFEISSNSIGKGSAWLSTTNTNTDKRYIYVRNYEDISFEGTDGYIYISIQQSKIDDPYLNDETGTDIATIEVSSQGFPSSNYIPLATIVSGVIEDNRHIVDTKGKDGDFLIDDYFTSINNLNKEIQKNSFSDHLEEVAYIGEKYTINDKLFKQETPKLNNSTVDADVGNIEDNREIHIQRMGSGNISNKLKLKMRSEGSPSTNVVVEVRKGIKVDISSTEAYWYGDEKNIIATGILPSSNFSNEFEEVEFTLNNNFGGTEGELLDIVVYQSSDNGAVINENNYYIIACDSTQWSEAFSYVKVNGQTRSRLKLMPYCISDGFAQIMLCKAVNGEISITYNKQVAYKEQSGYTPYYTTVSVPYNGSFKLTARVVNVSQVTTARCTITGGGTQLVDTDMYNSGKDRTFNYDYTGGGTASVRYYLSTSGSYQGNVYLTLYCYSLKVYKDVTKILKLLPREIKDIGETVSVTSFGEHIDGSFYNEIPNSLKLHNDYYDATGSDITNFKGYIRIKIDNYYYDIPLKSRSSVS